MLPGERIKKVRTKLGITTREVEDFSRQIAAAESNSAFHVSSGWLTEIENTDSVPSIYKLYSLSVICRISFLELTALYGLDLDRIAKHQLSMPLPRTHLAPLKLYQPEKRVTFPIKFKPRFAFDKTSPLSRIIKQWGEVPISIIQNLNLRHNEYGFIGLKDRTLDPLLPPGSFVRIDTHANRITNEKQQIEFDRPIYFLELNNGYACSWCEIQGNKITLVPHPLSPAPVRQFTYQKEARIMGRVTAIAMQIVRPETLPFGASSRSPVRP